jgi:phosphatidylglycerol:prolipoprotein diacylglycerol transferase
LQVVGKIGCFLAGCCYGTPSGLPWSVVPIARGASRGVALHPVQLYEAAFYVVLGLALWANRRRLAAGGMAWIYLAGYGSIRFVAEYFRGDVVPWRPGLTVGQGAAILLLLAGLVVAAGGRGRERVHPQ